jgi:hypothetical protein
MGVRGTKVDKLLTQRDAAAKGARNTGKRARISPAPYFGFPKPANLQLNVAIRLDLDEMSRCLSSAQIKAVMNGIASVLIAAQSPADE